MRKRAGDLFAVAETAEILPEKLRAVREVQIDTDPLYIVFTSGSTGVPKGVCACHRSVIDYTEALSAALDFDEHCVFGNQTPLYFDAPLKEIMPALKFGATVWFIPRQCFLFPMLLCDFLNRHEINTVCFVASALTMVSSLGVLKKNPPRYLRTVAFGSEVFPAAQYNLWKAALPSARFFNLYGPTECTGMSCFYEVKGFLPEEKPIPIGRPFRNTAAFLLDGEGKRILPIPGETGEAGELYLRGTCVTLGYYQNPEKTAEAFLQNPLQSAYPEPVYKTGDLCRYDGDGNLLFVARADQQIKHMGHRIELGEIEAAAHRTGGVTAVCCFYDAEKKRIHLCFAGSITGSELKAALKELLPRYMLPGECHRLERLPMTPNGKIDRRALREAYLPKDGAGADGAETPGANAPV